MHSVEEAQSKRGAYSDGRSKRAYKPSVLAYVDFLGYSQAIVNAAENGLDQRLLNKTAKFVASWRDVLIDRYTTYRDARGWEVRFFTDNIVLAYPIRDAYSDSEMGSVLSSLGLFQISAIEAGFFVRGGMAVGRAYVDEMMVFGVPIVDAHHAESCLAIAPRVVLSRSARLFLSTRLGKREYRRNSPYWHDIVQDEDGQFFVNYLEQTFRDYTEPPAFSVIDKHRRVVQKKLREFRKDTHIGPKYEWTARYHNFWCDSWRLTEYVIPGYAPLAITRLDEIDNVAAD